MWGNCCELSSGSWLPAEVVLVGGFGEELVLIFCGGELEGFLCEETCEELVSL